MPIGDFKGEIMLKKISFKIVFGFIILLVAAGVGTICFQFTQKATQAELTQENIKNKTDKAETKIKEVLSKLEEADTLYKIGDIKTQEAVIGLTFNGLAERDIMHHILDLLEQYQVKGTFFVPGIKVAEDTSIVKDIKNAGYVIGSYGLSGQEKMEQLSRQELVEDFVRTNIILKKITWSEPTLLMCNRTQYTDEVLKVAQASGYESIVESTHFLNYQSFTSYEMALNYVRKLEKGVIVTVKLDGYIGEGEYESKIEETQAAVDKQATITKQPESVKAPESTEMKRLLQVITWLLQAMEEVKYETVWVQDLHKYKMEEVGEPTDHQILEQKAEFSHEITVVPSKSQIKTQTLNYEMIRLQNQGMKAKVIQEIYTTQKGIALTFSGISNQQALEKTLESLGVLQVKATFFVLGEEAIAYPERIASIQQAGHEIGSSGFTGEKLSEKSFEQVCDEIHRTKKVLEEQGIHTSLFMPPYGTVSDTLAEAVSAMGYNLVTYTSMPVRGVYQELEAQAIVSDYYKKYKALRRGEIIYLRMDYYTDPEKVGQLIQEIYTQKIVNTGYYKAYDSYNESGYHMMPVSELLQKTYTYPVPQADQIKQAIRPGQLEYSTAWDDLKSRYIGNPYKQSTESLGGFTEEEVTQLNNTGRIDTNGENVIFITFDDWGSDAAINPLLYVLKKHGVASTFFVRSNYISYNPNLLRAIAEDGHDIASHTSTHYTIDIGNDQVQPLREDLIKSYSELANVVGDRQELKLLFRPPTLAVTKIGLQTVLDCGFSYVVSGNFSTKDYEQQSVQELKNKLEQGILLNKEGETLKPGSIVIMHMSDESRYTAETLDLFFMENEQKLDTDPTKYQFAKLSDYLK